MHGFPKVFSTLPKYEIFLEEVKHFPDLDASACYTFMQLLKTGDELLAMDEQVLSSMGVRHGRLKLLMMLLKSDCSSSPADLAKKTGVTRATISGLLDGLQKEGLIERHSNADDRRLIEVRLTPAGKALLDKVRPVYSRWFASVIEPLTEPERQQLVTLLQKIQNRLAQVSTNEPVIPDQAA
jgi:DNA-binding MarR family transcriptional regulator